MKVMVTFAAPLGSAVCRVSKRAVSPSLPALRHVDRALFRQYRRHYEGLKIDREALYDCASLR